MRAPTLLIAAAIVAAPAHAQLCSGISEASDTPLTTVLFASGFVRPLFVTAPPGDPSRVLVVEQDGTVRLFKDGVAQATPFLDITSLARSPVDGGGDEEGLLGLAFDPAYATSGFFFVYHTNAASNNVVARYARSANPDVADPASRSEVITFSHPTQTNHNGGMIGFGPVDGYLYIATGDGGSFCDPNGNAQNGLSNLGKLHRIDVDPLPYTIPADNPFVSNAAFNDEIWAYGLRNPYRWSFDRANGDLYIGDVGQGTWEEIDVTAAPDAGRGANFGWDRYEGTACPNPSCGSQGSCTIPSYVPPVLQYSSASPNPECSVTGGYVYRGCRMPALRGTYFYADYCSGKLSSFVMSGGVPTNQLNRTAELAPGGGLVIDDVTSWGEDARGEIYVVDRAGEVFKVVPVLSNLEVSGEGASSFTLSRAGDWSWEDLKLTSSHPIVEYQVYRSVGNGSGSFDCIRRQAGTVWAGGDPNDPTAGGLYSYVVTATNAAGTRTSPGTSTSGTPRALSAAACP
jgi:glucose/arabinose dehydrogenase